ncbi:oxidoreductase [Massilia arenosa]|uniref:NADPH--hemoprotein reductase n=1 Tax=Zemynaea arenosa TaxID=2561931 RepID=A0A4Y9S5T0_9BURK|nr:sulfite reductase subunit alpha [Massilia arenosa]TFW16722.1 oxidoreductase [Massilia arenosa]
MIAALTLDPMRWAAAGVLLAMYALLCVAVRRRAQSIAASDAQWLVAYASQTGTAETLASQTVATLRTAGLSAEATPLSALDEARLAGAERVLFVVSTFGEGDAPDNGVRFAERWLGRSASLSHLHYAVLALGDTSYQHFCGFARSLDAWLAAQGAQALFQRIEVDRGDARAVEAWQEHLCHLSGASDVDAWTEPEYEAWTLVERTELNPGSAGAPVYRIRLKPAGSALPQWQSGDLVQVSAPAEPHLPREFSIGSIPAEGHVELLVRLQVHVDGSLGVASGWLCRGAGVGGVVSLRVRPHARFQLGENARRPVLFIGNGTGIAGLRAHLAQRIAAGEYRNWLLFGERSAAHDYHDRATLEAWRARGALARIDTAFSRDQSEKRYVQHVLLECADEVRRWVEEGGAIYVCGSLRTMAAGVHEALVSILGAPRVNGLADEGRYRRDVY